jgi:hypothetical protein
MRRIIVGGVGVEGSTKTTTARTLHQKAKKPTRSPSVLPECKVNQYSHVRAVLLILDGITTILYLSATGFCPTAQDRVHRPSRMQNVSCPVMTHHLYSLFQI